MLVRCSRDLRYRFISEAYAQMIGRQPRRGHRQNHRRNARREGLQHAPPLYRGSAARRGGGFRMRARLSEYRHAPSRHRLPAGTDAEGNVGGWIASLLDVTEQKSIEAELRALSEKLEAEVERAHAGARPHLERLRGLARGFQFRRLFPQHEIRPGRGCSAGPRTKSSPCMSANCAIRTTRRTPSPAARSSRKACRPCAWKIASVTRTAHGAGCNGP